MQFIGQYKVDDSLCDRLIELHKAADKRGMVVRGRLGGYTDGTPVVDIDRKDSYDLGIITVPDDMLEKYGVPDYYQALKGCVDNYFDQHPILKNVGQFSIAETPIIQRYKPGGGFKFEHFERTGIQSTTRFLTWMTYLNDVTDGGGTHFTYQKTTMKAEKGKTLIWPSDFTHTHVGEVSPTQEKYIITGWLNYIDPRS
jgi:prolyl 4-hydroxylase